MGKQSATAQGSDQSAEGQQGWHGLMIGKFHNHAFAGTIQALVFWATGQNS